MQRIALGRDDLMRYAFAPDVFEQNAALLPVQEDILACKAAYLENAKSNKCNCGGNPRLVFECLDKLLDRLEYLKAENPPAVEKFVEYIGRRNGTEVTTVTVYYRKTAEIPLKKYTFP